MRLGHSSLRHRQLVRESEKRRSEPASKANSASSTGGTDKAVGSDERDSETANGASRLVAVASRFVPGRKVLSSSIGKDCLQHQHPSGGGF